MKTCFISRLGGIGDVIHAAHLPQLIKKHYGVDKIDFETNYNGFHILTNNPYIDDLQFVNVNSMTFNRMNKHLEWAREKYDMVFDLANTIEKAYCSNENDHKYFRTTKWRQEHLGKKSYYDVMVDAVGLPDKYYGTRPTLYYPAEDSCKAKNWVKKVKEENDSDFVIIINLSGSTLHKKFIQVEEVSKMILERYPKALIYLSGDEHCTEQLFDMDRVISKVGTWNFRTVALQCNYVDLTISLESGLALVAHSWDAPTLQLLTAASYDNHVKYARNAWHIQSEVACSPCHRNPREFFGCPIREEHPECIFFNIKEIIDKVGEAYEYSKKTS